VGGRGRDHENAFNSYEYRTEAGKRGKARRHPGRPPSVSRESRGRAQPPRMSGARGKEGKKSQEGGKRFDQRLSRAEIRDGEGSTTRGGGEREEGPEGNDNTGGESLLALGSTYRTREKDIEKRGRKPWKVLGYLKLDLPRFWAV